MSLTSTICAIAATAFGGGVLSSQLLHSSNCLCDCSGGDQAAPLLDLVKSQLDRCGPEQLVSPAPVATQREAPQGHQLTLYGCLIAGAVTAVALLIWRLPRRSGLLEIAENQPDPLDAAAVPRWRPSGGSSARQL